VVLFAGSVGPRRRDNLASEGEASGFEGMACCSKRRHIVELKERPLGPLTGVGAALAQIGTDAVRGGAKTSPGVRRRRRGLAGN